MPVLVPACVWRTSDDLVVALDNLFGEPVDAYVNGSQVWLREDGPGGEVFEWRLHPVPGFRRPEGVSHHELFGVVALALATGQPAPQPPARLWDGLEAFPAYGEDLEPATLAASAVRALGIPPLACGLVDHDGIADQWERARGQLSIVESLLSQLRPGGGQPA
ncbi:MAG: hypothetical protein HYX34_04455 [Actinobacteria bacterium]|nr:hypothetical protein [Actinomycetota bacterium]